MASITAESSSLASAEIISAISRMVSNICSHILSEADSSRVPAVASRKSVPTEKQDAAIDRRLPCCNCCMRSSRNVLFTLLISSIYSSFGAYRLYLQMATGRFTKRPQDTKEARNMALLLNREAVGIARITR